MAAAVAQSMRRVAGQGGSHGGGESSCGAGKPLPHEASMSTMRLAAADSPSACSSLQRRVGTTAAVSCELQRWQGSMGDARSPMNGSRNSSKHVLACR